MADVRHVTVSAGMDASSRVAAPAVRTTALTKRYGRTLALDRVDLEVPRGLVFGYLGPNGAGKSTTIRLLTGLLRPTSGRVEVLGRDVSADRDAAQELIGYLPGDFVAHPELTGGEYLGYLAALRGGVDPGRLQTLAERLDLPLGRRIGTLSHGNRTCWCSTSRPTGSTPWSNARSWTSSWRPATPAAPSSCRPTCSARSRPWPTSWASSGPGGSW
jgi:ABC-type glutathione transport system ATPase component